MRRILHGVFIVLLVAGLAWAGWTYWQEKRLLNQGDVLGLADKVKPYIPPLSQPEQTQQIATVAISTVTYQATQAAEIAVEKSAEVLGASIQISTDSSKPLPERAMDYARYQYCKQVVEEYEK